MTADNEMLVDRGDADELTSRIDSLALDAEWDLVIDLRDRCRAALARGKQLWPCAAYAEYRIALDAPPDRAVTVLDSPSERFSPGSFAEVIASRRTFAELSDHLPSSPAALVIAHERVARGDDLSTHGLNLVHDPFDMPLRLASWEPARYSSPEFTLAGVRDDAPAVSGFGTRVVNDKRVVPRAKSEKLTEESLRDLTSPWVAQSNGRCEVVTVRGSNSDALQALGCRAHRLAPLTPQQFMSLTVWAGSSGGAHGRRRGLAAGRHVALWAMIHLVGMAEEVDTILEPVFDDVEALLPEFRFYAWDDGSPATGWSLRIAIEDLTEGFAFACNASDVRL